MKSILVLLFISIFLITFTSAQLGYNNPKLPKITSPTTTTITSSGGAGANVTSVTSSTNCITISPTTGAVILTFNSSCGGGRWKL